MIEMCDFKSEEEFLEWLQYDHSASTCLTRENYQKAYEHVLTGWQKRAEERGYEIPASLDNACKFSSLFMKLVFGGRIEGNYDHQFNVIENTIVDLTQDSPALKNMENPYEHDELFFGNEEHMESLISCMPRVLEWVRDYEKALTMRIYKNK